MPAFSANVALRATWHEVEDGVLWIDRDGVVAADRERVAVAGQVGLLLRDAELVGEALVEDGDRVGVMCTGSVSVGNQLFLAASSTPTGICSISASASGRSLYAAIAMRRDGWKVVYLGADTPLRDAITRESAKRALSITALGNDYQPIGRIYDEKAVVNGVVGLLAKDAISGPLRDLYHPRTLLAALGS